MEETPSIDLIPNCIPAALTHNGQHVPLPSPLQLLSQLEPLSKMVSEEAWGGAAVAHLSESEQGTLNSMAVTGS